MDDGLGGDRPPRADPPGREIIAPAKPSPATVETPEGDLTITADASVDQVDRNVDALTERLVVGLPALVALVGVIAWVLVGRALRPVEAMRAEAERITDRPCTVGSPSPPPTTRSAVWPEP